MVPLDRILKACARVHGRRIAHLSRMGAGFQFSPEPSTTQARGGASAERQAKWHSRGGPNGHPSTSRAVHDSPNGPRSSRPRTAETLAEFPSRPPHPRYETPENPRVSPHLRRRLEEPDSRVPARKPRQWARPPTTGEGWGRWDHSPHQQSETKWDTPTSPQWDFSFQHPRGPDAKSSPVESGERRWVETQGNYETYHPPAPGPTDHKANLPLLS